MRGVTFDTLATDKEEVELILDESDWQSLLSRVKSGENIAVKSGEEGASVSPPPHIDDTILISNAAVIKGALCQNHLKGFAVLSTILLPVLDKLNDFGETTPSASSTLSNRTPATHSPPSGSGQLFLSLYIWLSLYC